MTDPKEPRESLRTALDDLKRALDKLEKTLDDLEDTLEPPEQKRRRQVRLPKESGLP